MPQPKNVSLCSCTYVFNYSKNFLVKLLFQRIGLLKFTMGTAKKAITIHARRVHVSTPLPTYGLSKIFPIWLSKKDGRTNYFNLCFPDTNKFSSVQLLSRVWLFATPWTAVCQDSLPITNSRSLLKLMSIKSVMPFNHLILLSPSSPAFNLSQHCGLFQCFLALWLVIL